MDRATNPSTQEAPMPSSSRSAHNPALSPFDPRAALVLALLLGTMSAALLPRAGRADTFSVDVPGTANLYGAGHATPPAPDGHGGGLLPTLVDLAAGAERTVRILGASGTISFTPSVPPNGADGVASASYSPSTGTASRAAWSAGFGGSAVSS
jgi:hypothetical protein